MASREYHHGEMDIQAQQATWHGFIVGGTWAALLTFLIIGYSTLAVALGVNWMISLGLMAVFGLAVGLFLNLGGRWIATVVLLVLAPLVPQALIWLFTLAL
jgi:hypothetical protein